MVKVKKNPKATAEGQQPEDDSADINDPDTDLQPEDDTEIDRQEESDSNVEMSEVDIMHQAFIWISYDNVAPPSESQIPDPAVTLSDPDNDRLSVIRRPSGIRFCLSSALARTYL